MGMLGHRIGNILKESGRENLVASGAIRSGNLRSSVNYKIINSSDGFELFFGAKANYAAMVEFGGTFTPDQKRAMFANFSRRGQTKLPSKGILKGNVYRKRPFLGPAIRDNRARIRGIIKEFMRPDK